MGETQPNQGSPRPSPHQGLAQIGPEPEALEQAGLVEPPLRTTSLTADGRLTGGRLAGLTMTGAIITLTWPILAESLLNSLVGLTDTVLSAAIDDNGASTDAVGGAVTILWFVQLVVQAIGVGATALISRAVGARKVGVANAAIGQTMILAAVCGSFVGAGMALMAAPAAGAMNLSPTAAAGFIDYIRLNAIGVPFGSLLFAGIACARGAGDSLRPLLAMIIVNAVNFSLAWYLSGVHLAWMPQNPSTFDLGVRGIALGTMSAYIVGCIVMTGMLWRGVGGVRLRWGRLKPHWHTLRRLVRVGIPNFFETLGMWAGNMLIILMVGKMGADHPGLLGSHLVAVRIEAFSYLPGFAFASASATLVGQYLGAGSAALARRAVYVCATAAAVFMGLMGVLFILRPTAIVGLMTSQEVHLHESPPLLFTTGWVQFPFAISIVFRSALRGAGDVKAAMWLTWITTYGLRLPMAFAFSGVGLMVLGHAIDNPFPWKGGLLGVWIGLCAEIVIRGGLFWHRFASGAWAKTRV